MSARIYAYCISECRENEDLGDARAASGGARGRAGLGALAAQERDARGELEHVARLGHVLVRGGRVAHEAHAAAGAAHALAHRARQPRLPAERESTQTLYCTHTGEIEISSIYEYEYEYSTSVLVQKSLRLEVH